MNPVLLTFELIARFFGAKIMDALTPQEFPQLFIKAFENTLSREGSYVNDRQDPGGETKYGISKRSYPKLDIKNLTQYQAKQIYFADFWLNGKYEEFVDDNLAIKLFDLAVNVGPVQANQLLQQDGFELFNRKSFVNQRWYF
jgi:hypothetical protein